MPGALGAVAASGRGGVSLIRIKDGATRSVGALLNSHTAQRLVVAAAEPEPEPEPEPDSESDEPPISRAEQRRLKRKAATLAAPVKKLQQTTMVGLWKRV